MFFTLLTQETMNVVGYPLIWPVIILQVPYRPLLPGWNVPNCQTAGGITTGIVAKLTDDPELPERQVKDKCSYCHFK